jgi:hypothetical protein
MSPSRVDSNKKQAKSSIDQVEEDLFYFDRMGTAVSAPSQATVYLADKTPQDLYYECLDEGEARQFPTPNLLYKINMQARYAAARATVSQYTLPVAIPKNTFSAYGDSDEDSDSPPPSPKKTDEIEMKIDKYPEEKFVSGFFILQKQLANQGIFLMRSKLSITAHLFLALYRSTTLQSRSFLRNIKTFLCK